MPPQQSEEDAHPQCHAIGGTHHSRRINESATQDSSQWFWGWEGIYTITTTPESELVDGPTGYMEAAATTAKMVWMTVRGNRINNG